MTRVRRENGEQSTRQEDRKHRAARGFRRMGYAIAILLALAFTWYATSNRPAGSDVAAGGHDHAAMMAAGGSQMQTVVLDEEQSGRIGMTFAVARMAALEKEVRTVGQVTIDEARQHVITARVDGYVDSLLVNTTGQSVRQGQVLLYLFSPMLVQAQEELLLAARLAGKIDATGSMGATGSLLEAARRRLDYWNISAEEIAAIESEGLVRRSLKLNSPFGGYVLEKNVVEGQQVHAGDVLYRVADMSRVWVEGEVFEQDLTDVRVGQLVRAEFEALPGEHRQGRISYVYPTVSPETRTARVRFELSNANYLLRPGMYATLRIAASARPSSLVVPRESVLMTGQRNMVFVRGSNGRLVPREVMVGAANDSLTEVLSGLAAGEIVVSSATFLLDAESNLGRAVDRMSEMSGMDARARGETSSAPDPHKH